MLKDVSSASTVDVCEWVGSLGLDEYVATFQHHRVDGAQLLQLTDDVLRIELGISKIGHRARIRRERDALAARSKSFGAGEGGVVALRQTPLAPAVGSGRIKVSVRVGAAGQWVNIRLTPRELPLAVLRQRVASALNMDEAAVERMKYRSGADWFAVLRDQDILDCVADGGGDALILQVGSDADDSDQFGSAGQLALVGTEPAAGELSVVDSKQQVNLLWHGITWHQRLRALLARGEVQEALDALLEWHGARAAMAQSPAAVYNALLKLVNDTQLPSPVAVTTYEMMRSRGVKPNAATYDHLLRALIRDGKPEVAARVLVSMEQTGHRPDPSAYNGIIQSLADRGGRGDLTMGLQIAAKGIEIEVSITVNTFNKLLASCARDGSTDEGVSSFKLLQKSGQTPDEESYGSLLACTCMGSDVGLSMKAMQGMINAGYSPKMNLVNRVLGACTTSEQATEVFKIVGDLQDVQLNSRSYAELMRCVRTEGNLQLGVHSLKTALRAGVYLDGDVVGSIIDMAVESVDKAEQDRLETVARLQEQTEARSRAELAQEESEQGRLNALALAKANKDEATSWREQAAAAEDAAAEGGGSFGQFEAEWQWMETITQDEVEQRANAVFTEKVAVDRQLQAEATANEQTTLRLEAEDCAEEAVRAKLVSDAKEQNAMLEAASWRETAMVAESAMENIESSSFQTPAIEWQWMEAAVQDEVAMRAAEEAARQHAGLTQAQAEKESGLVTIALNEAVAASEADQRARLLAQEEARAAKEETETWRSTAMAAEVAVAEALEQSGAADVDEWGFMESLMVDEAQAHAVVQVEYDAVMEKIGTAAANGTLSSDDAKALAQSEIDARLAAEKESAAAKETLAAAEIRWRMATEAAEARATEAEKRMIAIEKRGSEMEKNMRDETTRLQQHAERRVAESQSRALEEAAKRERLEQRATEEAEARKVAEAAVKLREAEVEAARQAAAQAETEGQRKVQQAHAAALKAAEQEAERHHAEELRASKEAAAKKAAAVPRAATPEPVSRAKTPPPPVPAGRSSSTAKDDDDVDDAAAQAKSAPKASTKSTPPIPGGSKAAKTPPVSTPKGSGLFGKSKGKGGAAATAAKQNARPKQAAKASGAPKTAGKGGLFGGGGAGKKGAETPSPGKSSMAATKEYKVVCPGGVLARAGFQMSSKKAGTLQADEVIQALETKVNANGITRVRFSGRLTGWASTKASDGTMLLEKVGGTVSVSSSTAVKYTATVNGLVREGFAMTTKKAGTLKKGSTIESIETKVNDKGVTRVRFDNGQISGWASTKAGDGTVLLEKVGVGAEDDVSEGPPGRMVWYASGDDELDVTVKEFKALVRKGVITDDTEVWVDEIMDDWLPFGEAGMAKLLST